MGDVEVGEEFRREPLDGAAGQQLITSFVEEVRAFYPSWDPSVGPSADPHEFEPPGGGFFVLYVDGRPAGCGGFKRLDERTAEIKRMFVAQEVRGRGCGRRILERLEQGAREAGYLRVRLDTGDRLPAAPSLYRSAGYREIPDYNGNPAATNWFEKDLQTLAA